MSRTRGKKNRFTGNQHYSDPEQSLAIGGQFTVEETSDDALKVKFDSCPHAQWIPKSQILDERFGPGRTPPSQGDRLEVSSWYYRKTLGPQLSPIPNKTVNPSNSRVNWKNHPINNTAIILSKFIIVKESETHYTIRFAACKGVYQIPKEHVEDQRFTTNRPSTAYDLELSRDFFHNELKGTLVKIRKDFKERRRR
jgi:hypothetical protein